MTLTHALKILKEAPADGSPFEVLLACGFTTLHLEKLLAAHLQETLPGKRVTVKTGLFGDLAGTLETSDAAHGVAVALEWSDLDARLGYRTLGGWGPEQEPDLVANVRRSCLRIRTAVERIAARPVAFSLPTLELPPVFHTAGWQAGETQWDLELAMAEFARELARLPHVRIANRGRLAAKSEDARRDAKSDLFTGLPYPLEHASDVAGVLANLIHAPAPKKGLITDLDDTLWHGIVGEIGADGVSWDLSSHQQIHGLYQQMLKALAGSGVLIGIASKNSREVVEEALRRPDLVVPAEKIFPVEVHWNAKSGSVANIVKAWNVSADAVVFVDDSPIELAEVASQHPGITCLQFPKGNPNEALALFRKLRDLFGKPRLAEEDTYRMESIRRAAEFQQAAGEQTTASEELLSGLGAEVVLDFECAGDARALELVNKTNQFNLNGTRYTEAEWREELSRRGSFLAVVSYKDKFGPLGKIAVVQGHVENRELRIGTWVMSCRAFARRIEHLCMAALLEEFGADAASLRYVQTSKNGPTRDFLSQAIGEEPNGDGVRVTKEKFESRCPKLYHALEIKKAAESYG